MNALFGRRPSSTVTVILVLFVILLIQAQISYSLTIGKLATVTRSRDWIIGAWTVVRLLALTFVEATDGRVGEVHEFIVDPAPSV